MRHHCSTLLCYAILFISTVAAQTNRTIDDTLGDSVTGTKIIYLPTSFNGDPVWNSSSSCANSNSSCAIMPDSSRAYDNTWTTSTYFSNITKVMAKFTFTGTAVYIYIIQTNNPTTATVNSSTILRFNVDGHVVGNYDHISDESSNFQYNVLAYSTTSLVDANHTVIFETTGSDPSTVFFDYAMYTTNAQATTLTAAAPSSSTSSSSSSDSTTTAKKKAPIGAIVGGVIGVITILALALLALALCGHRSHSKYTPPMIDAFLGGRDVKSVVDLGESALQPTMTDLQQQITERRHVMTKLEQRSHSASDGSDMRQQLEEMRTQIQRLEAQHQSRSGLANDLASSSLGASPASHTDGSQSRSRRDRPPAGEPEVLVHSDSGLRSQSDSGLLELPPAYAAE